MRQRVLGLLVFVVMVGVLATRADAQVVTENLTTTTCPGDGCVVLGVTDNASVAIGVTGTFVGTLAFEGTLDGATFTAITVSATATLAQVTTATGTGLWQGSAAGLTAIRVRFSAYTSGTAQVTLQAATSGGSVSSASASGSTNISAINSVTPLMGAGATGTGSLRVTLADASAVNVSAINGVTPLMGAGATGTGSLRVTLATGDPCAGAKTVQVINQTADTQLFVGTASSRTYICHFSVVTATLQNLALVSGTGVICGTSVGPVLGGTTAATGWNFVANGGIVLGSGVGTVGKSDTDADNICMLQSGAGQVSGVITYVVAAN